LIMIGVIFITKMKCKKNTMAAKAAV